MPRLDLYLNYELQASFRLERSETVLGRAMGCAVQLPDMKVSRRHAVIHAQGDGHVIENIGVNGTRINGLAIEGRHALQGGDTIFISNCILVYQPDDAPVQQMGATIIS